MRTVASFVAGAIGGWLLCSWAVRQVVAKAKLDTVSGTISSPDGEWEFTGATLTASPWTRRTSTKR